MDDQPEARIAELEARIAALETRLGKTQKTIKMIVNVYDRNFARLSGRVAQKSDGFLSDIMDWF